MMRVEGIAFDMLIFSQAHTAAHFINVLLQPTHNLGFSLKLFTCALVEDWDLMIWIISNFSLGDLLSLCSTG